MGSPRYSFMESHLAQVEDHCLPDIRASEFIFKPSVAEQMLKKIRVSDRTLRSILSVSRLSGDNSEHVYKLKENAQFQIWTKMCKTFFSSRKSVNPNFVDVHDLMDSVRLLYREYVGLAPEEDETVNSELQFIPVIDAYKLNAEGKIWLELWIFNSYEPECEMQIARSEIEVQKLLETSGFVEDKSREMYFRLFEKEDELRRKKFPNRPDDPTSDCASQIFFRDTERGTEFFEMKHGFNYKEWNGNRTDYFRSSWGMCIDVKE